jgi:hypothetical protein
MGAEGRLHSHLLDLRLPEVARLEAHRVLAPQRAQQYDAARRCAGRIRGTAHRKQRIPLPTDADAEDDAPVAQLQCGELAGDRTAEPSCRRGRPGKGHPVYEVSVAPARAHPDAARQALQA